MIHETTIDASLNRLIAHFGSQVVFRPPAPAAQLAELAALVGPLPRDLRIFLATCNGLRIDADICGVLGRIWSVHEMLAAVRGDEGIALPAGLVPVLGQAVAECDCVVVAATPARDAVVRWDASATGAILLSSSFEQYLDAWTRFVVAPTPASRSKRVRHCFGVECAGKRDSVVAALRQDRGVQAWLRSLDVAVACGDDFE